MKRYLLLLFAAAALIAGCDTLKVAMNTTDKDGKRIVATSSQRLFSFGGANVALGLSTKIDRSDTTLAIYLESDKDSDHGIFQKGDRIMIRFEDGSEYSFDNIWDREYSKDVETTYTEDYITNNSYAYTYSPWCGPLLINPYDIGIFVPHTYTRQTTNSYGLYLVTKEQLEKIVADTIIKLRVEIEDRDLDMPNPARTSAVVANVADCLKYGIANPVKRTKF